MPNRKKTLRLAAPAASATIGVLFDGSKRRTRLHRSYVELDDDMAKRNAIGYDRKKSDEVLNMSQRTV
jgi:hypothetical protein